MSAYKNLIKLTVITILKDSQLKKQKNFHHTSYMTTLYGPAEILESTWDISALEQVLDFSSLITVISQSTVVIEKKPTEHCPVSKL